MTENDQQTTDPAPRKATHIAKGMLLLVFFAILGALAGFLLGWVPAAVATGSIAPPTWPVGIRFAVYVVATWGGVASVRATLAKAARHQQVADTVKRYMDSVESGGSAPKPSSMGPGESWSHGPGGGRA